MKRKYDQKNNKSGNTIFTVQTDHRYCKDIKKQYSSKSVWGTVQSTARKRRYGTGAYLQNTNLMTLGIFLVGFLVSPAVTPKLSVPPSALLSR